MDGIPTHMFHFYEELYLERNRLRQSPHGRLELARTRELLERFIPQAAQRVIDVGGGTGVHAEWLAARGHVVDLIDVVASHVDEAAELPGVRAQVGDARALPFADATADAVLVLGPLYHLTNRDDRIKALQEARRVARPGAPVLVAAISRHSPLLVFGCEGELDDQTLPLVRQAMDTGRHDERLGFTIAHLHTAGELRAELEEAGLVDVEVLGVEGPAWPALDAHGLDRIDQLLPAAIRAAQLVEADPAMIAASAHFLAVGSAR